MTQIPINIPMAFAFGVVVGLGLTCIIVIFKEYCEHVTMMKLTAEMERLRGEREDKEIK